MVKKAAAAGTYLTIASNSRKNDINTVFNVQRVIWSGSWEGLGMGLKGLKMGWEGLGRRMKGP